MAVVCDLKNEFKVGGYCKSLPHSDVSCNTLTKNDCLSTEGCTYVKPYCKKGHRSNVPPERRWIQKVELKGEKLTNFMPDGKMPFNQPLDEIREACKEAGIEMKKENIPFKKAFGKVIFAYNVRNRWDGTHAQWDKQRSTCLEAIKEAYGK